MNLSSAECSRRKLLRTALFAGASATVLANVSGCAGAGSNTTVIANHPNTTDIQNFYLNLEYLEAEFYLRATTGSGLDANLAGGASAGAVTGGRPVPFSTPVYQQLAAQMALQEKGHVVALRNILFSLAVPRPHIDLTGGFKSVSTAAGLGASFDPFADEQSFLLGAFFLEDLMVDAYAAAATTSGAFVGILGNEAYHAGCLRTLIYLAGGGLAAKADMISSYRSSYGGGADQTVDVTSGFNGAPGSASGTILNRSFAQTLGILYQSRYGSPGSFFPNRINGYIS